MKKLLLIAFLLFTTNCWAEYREIPENVWINAPEDFQPDLWVSGNERVSVLLDDDGVFALPASIKCALASFLYLENTDSAVNLWLSNYADENSMGNNITNIVSYIGSSNPNIYALGASFTADGATARPAHFLAINGALPVLITGDLEVTGQIINPQLEELERRITELEDKLK